MSDTERKSQEPEITPVSDTVSSTDSLDSLDSFKNRTLSRRRFLQAVGAAGAVAAAERVLNNPVAHALAPDASAVPTPSPEAAVSPEMVSLLPIEFSIVSNVETTAREFNTPLVSEIVGDSGARFRDAPNTIESKFINPQEPTLLQGTHFEKLAIPRELLTEEEIKQLEDEKKEKLFEIKRGEWIWFYGQPLTKNGNPISPEERKQGFIASRNETNTILAQDTSYEDLPDSVRTQLEGEKKRYRVLEIPKPAEELGYNLSSLSQEFTGIGGGDEGSERVLEIAMALANKQDEETFIKQSADNPSVAFARYLAGVLVRLESNDMQEKILPGGIVDITSTETHLFSEVKFGMRLVVKSEDELILLTSRLGENHILAVSITRNVTTAGETSYTYGRFSALSPADIQSLITQTPLASDEEGEVKGRFEEVYKNVPIAAKTAKLDLNSGKLTLDPKTDEQAVKLLTGLSTGIYLEKLATIASPAPAEQGDAVAYTYDEAKGQYLAEVKPQTASPDTNVTTKYYTYVPAVNNDEGEWRIQENNHYSVEGENYKWFGGFDIDIHFPDGSRIVMTEEAPERLAEQVLAALAHQRGLSQEALQEELNRTNGKMEVIIPKGDSEFIGNETSLAIFTKKEIDFSKGIKIISREEPPEEDSQIKPGVNHKDKNGNLLPLWYFFSIENDQLVISISKSNIDLIPTSKLVIEKPEDLRPSAVGLFVSNFLFTPFAYLAYASEYEEVQKMLPGEEIREVTIKRQVVPGLEQFREFFFFKAISTARQTEGTPVYEDTDVLDRSSFYEYDQNNAENPYAFTLFKQE